MLYFVIFVAVLYVSVPARIMVCLFSLELFATVAGLLGSVGRRN